MPKRTWTLPDEEHASFQLDFDTTPDDGDVLFASEPEEITVTAADGRIIGTIRTA